MARLDYFEHLHQRKTIGSAGNWGYVLTMIGILEDALKNDYEQILVLDDDALFHNQFNELFAKILKQVPENWLVLQLGTLQYHWEKEWIEWYSENLYMCNGSSLTSHAIALRREVIPLILNHCYRMDMPYDEGPVHKPKYLFPRRCFTFYPNLLIQDVTESDISNEAGQKQALGKNNNVFRWNWDDYLV